MITIFIINIILYILTVLFGWLPAVDTLPFIDSYLVSAVGMIKTLSINFPIFGLVFDVFVIYIGFKLFMVVLKFFLGSRMPTLGVGH